jgi:anti-sigma regulatory factor (Ser/Thr protein kinase)
VTKPSAGAGEAGRRNTWRTLAAFTVPSEPGNERRAMQQVSAAVGELGLSTRRLEQLKTAVAEATLNAMEHGNHYCREVPVAIKVLASEMTLAVYITDSGGNTPIPEPVSPDLEAKLASQQASRGWGLFLIKSMVDDMHVICDETHHTVELILYLKGGHRASETA